MLTSLQEFHSLFQGRRFRWEKTDSGKTSFLTPYVANINLPDKTIEEFFTQMMRVHKWNGTQFDSPPSYQQLSNDVGTLKFVHYQTMKLRALIATTKAAGLPAPIEDVELVLPVVGLPCLSWFISSVTNETLMKEVMLRIRAESARLKKLAGSVLKGASTAIANIKAYDDRLESSKKRKAKELENKQKKDATKEAQASGDRSFYTRAGWGHGRKLWAIAFDAAPDLI